MEIYDTDGNVLEDRPDYDAGRLLEIDGRMTYVTWAECPQGTGIGAECGEQEPPENADPSIAEVMETAMLAQAQADYTAVMTDTVLEA